MSESAGSGARRPIEEGRLPARAVLFIGCWAFSTLCYALMIIFPGILLLLLIRWLLNLLGANWDEEGIGVIKTVMVAASVLLGLRLALNWLQDESRYWEPLTEARYALLLALGVLSVVGWLGFERTYCSIDESGPEVYHIESTWWGLSKSVKRMRWVDGDDGDFGWEFFSEGHWHRVWWR